MARTNERVRAPAIGNERRARLSEAPVSSRAGNRQCDLQALAQKG